MAEPRIRCTLIEVFATGPLAAAQAGQPAAQELSPWSDSVVNQLLQRLFGSGNSWTGRPTNPHDTSARHELPPPRDDDWSFGGLDPAFDDPWHRE